MTISLNPSCSVRPALLKLEFKIIDNGALMGSQPFLPVALPSIFHMSHLLTFLSIKLPKLYAFWE